MDDIQYALTFVGIAVGISLVYRFMMPPGAAPPSVMGMLGMEEPSNGPNGGQEVPCYNVPFKVMKTQYGDRAILAGYNENVQPYQTGAAGRFDHPSQVPEASATCMKVGYNEEKVI